MKKIWLASKSPRRAELLKSMGVLFDVLQFADASGIQYEVDESPHIGETPRQYVERVAMDKALYASEYLEQHRAEKRPILSADTTVALGLEIMGKPADAFEARKMLEALSGKSHEVLTAVVLVNGDKFSRVTSVSQVRFMPLTTDTIEKYIASGEPFDKAGGYGIQGYAGMFVTDIQGSFTGIMGLPVHETAHLLLPCGFNL